MDKPTPDTDASRIIDRLGGTGDVARMCDVDPAAVSQWRRNGIPKARLQFIRLARPEVLKQIPDQPEAA
ncbi:carph-isopro domain-containing protein [Paraburkholderia tropica]|uniref:carph-isopro domain-containing protein n=1 Tax=Paraburkholderia tropica TaxID=92647 RepID=UPI002AB70777|nr:hypothetical protein [Paraburkholderia tropica]